VLFNFRSSLLNIMKLIVSIHEFLEFSRLKNSITVYVHKIKKLSVYGLKFFFSNALFNFVLFQLLHRLFDDFLTSLLGS
jgi:hypothetical protein